MKDDMKLISNWEVNEFEDKIQIQTSKLIIEYSFDLDAITYYKKNTMEIILQEKAKDGRRILNAAVEQVFLTQEDEVIGGLGQQQDGAMNYRGRYASLCQYNVINAVPVIVSNMGYGILWDNYW